MSKKPWKKISSQLIYSDPWIKLTKDSVIQPDKKPGTHCVIKLKGGVGVVVINDKDEILLVAQYRYAPKIYSLEIPKGAFPNFSSKKNPLKTAKQELKEETGIVANQWKKLSKVHTLMGSTNDKVYLFLATNLSSASARLEGSEMDLKILTLPVSDIKTTIKNGIKIEDKIYHLTDATSIAAVYLALGGLKSKLTNSFK